MTKLLYVIGFFAGSYSGGLIASYLGANYFSIWNILASSFGAFLGSYAANRINASGYFS